MYNLKYESNNGTLTINLSGRINSDNAKAAEAEIVSIIKDNTHQALVLDFDGLEAISSAGLRIMLMLKKKESNFSIINASGDVYDVFEITGFSSIIDISKAYRHLSIENCEVIGEGAKGIIYRYDDDTIVKVYKADNCLDEIKDNSDLAHKAFIMGIPTAISYDIVKVGDRFGAVYELVKSRSLSELIAADPSKIEQYADMFSSLLDEVESVEVEEGELLNIKERIYGWAKVASKALSDEENAKVKQLIDETPDDLKVIHGDFHTNNIVIQYDEPLLLDLDTLAYGNSIFELANIHFAYIGYNSIYPEGNKAFLGLSVDECKRFYDLFISKHFATCENIEDIRNKISFVGYLRAANHILKRETDQSKINLCISFLKQYLSKVDSIGL